MAAIFIRTVIICIILTASMRFSGQRQIGELRLPEIVVTIVLSEVAALPLTNTDIPLLYAIIPMLVLVCFEIIFSFLSTKCSIVKRIIGVSPAVIIRRGVIDKSQMKKLRISVDDLMIKLRQSGVFDISDVWYAIFEETGELSVIPKGDKMPVTLSDIGKSDGQGMSFPVMIDGHTVKYALNEIGRDEAWLSGILSERNLLPSDIFLMTVNESGKTTVIRNDEVGQ